LSVPTKDSKALRGIARFETAARRRGKRVLHAFGGDALHLLGNEEFDPEENTLVVSRSTLGVVLGLGEVEPAKVQQRDVALLRELAEGAAAVCAAVPVAPHDGQPVVDVARARQPFGVHGEVRDDRVVSPKEQRVESATPAVVERSRRSGTEVEGRAEEVDALGLEWLS
jgi:hypothetical protein